MEQLGVMTETVTIQSPFKIKLFVTMRHRQAELPLQCPFFHSHPERQDFNSKSDSDNTANAFH